MKNIYKSFALLCMGLAATACIEENFENNGPKYDTTPGNEIVFSATAGIENGMPEPETRTVYGDQGTANGKNWIEINWVDNKDMVQIVSPEAAGPEVGHYLVTGASQQSGFNQTHRSASLTKLGDGALQWSESEDYTFYGVYPSFAYDTDTKHGATASLSKEGVFTGSMPIDQNYSLNEDGSAANGWIAAPDMRYAFMTAMDTYKREPADGYDDKTSAAERAINLEFKSMVTALQFDIKPGEINYNDPVTKETVSEMEVISVSLLSNKVDPEQIGKSISGSFSYNIPEDSYSATKGTRMVSLHFDNKSVKLSSGGESLNVTFFILPEDFDSTDKLQLQIIFKLGATQVSRIATINTSNKQKPILGGKKYIFNDVQLPALKTGVVSSSWWDTLDPDTILSQVSIPVASNVFANSSYDVDDPHHQQQSLSIENLWAMGVRGFEIANQSMVYKNNGALGSSTGPTWETVLASSLDAEPVIAAETELSETFKTSIDKLFRLMWGLKEDAATIPADAKKPTECIILICSYASKDDGYNPYAYVANLFNSLTNFCSRWSVNANDTFVQITKNSTVGDLAGKIAVIIRPGDDERWLYQKGKFNQGWTYTPQTDPFSTLGIEEDATNGLTALINNNTLKSDWWNRVLLISDWGTASYDVWDRRYGAEYTRAAAFNDLNISAGRATSGDKKQYENTLWAATENGISNIVPELNFNFKHSMSNGATAHVQEWMRVIPDGGINASVTSGRNTIYIKWPASILEKETAIKTLFEESISDTDKTLDDLYINVLTGYYATLNHPVSYYPFKQDCGNVTLEDMGKGGDFKGLADHLNEYTYNLLSKEPGTANGLSKQGPWGLVMMDHIKANDVSADLVELIMMNNFKFPLVTKDGVTPANYNATYSNGGEAISFK